MYIPRWPVLLAALWGLAGPAWAAGPDLKLSIRPDMQINTTAAGQLGTRDEGVGLAPGETVPAFTTNHYDGSTVRFAQLLEQAPLLVVFYRGGWCAYCNIQVRQMTEAAEQFAARGVTPVLISVDRPAGAALAQKSYDIPFPVLSDPGLAAHEAFRVVFQLDAQTREKYRGYGLVLEDWSGRDDGKYAVASVFLVDGQGRVIWSHASKDYATRPSVAQLLEVIDAHRAPD